jgi:hypothetical protein
MAEVRMATITNDEAPEAPKAQAPAPQTAPKRPDIEPAAVMKGEAKLPPFYSESYSDFMKRAQAQDPEYRHRWVNVSPRNQVLKGWKGWKPLVDKAELTRLGLSDLINQRGRAQWMDVELWRMPTEVFKLIRKSLDKKLANRSKAARMALDASAQDTAGRTGGKAVPFMTSGQDTPGEVLDRTHVPVPNPEKGKGA